jgi:protoporphyrinogen/coproporphyrinogen III oxidase
MFLPDPPALSTPPGRKLPVAVVGGGITGLAAAYRLSQHGIPFRLFEASDRLGGVIRSERDPAGWLIEAGPNSFQENSRELSALIGDLGLGAERVTANPLARKRFIVRGGKLQSVPLSPAALLTTPLISTAGKLRLLAELFSQKKQRIDDLSLAAFARAHVGHEIVEYLLKPFVSGVYAGDAEKLSARHAFPSLWEAEQGHGSLVRGFMAQARTRRARGVARPQIISFRHGLQMLPDALAAGLRSEHVELRAAVDHVSREPRRARRDTASFSPCPEECWRVHWTREGVAHADEFSTVILALPARGLADLAFGKSKTRPLASLAAIKHPPVASLFLGFHREEVAHALDGFGALVPPAEQRNILGVLFSSTLFPDRAPAGCVAVTVLVGGGLRSELAGLPEEALTSLVMADLRALLGVRGEPLFRRLSLWPRAIPQYNLGYETVFAAIDACERDHPGVLIGGQVRDGISLPACALAGLALAEKARSERSS